MRTSWGLLSGAVVTSRSVGYSGERELWLEWDKNFGLRKGRGDSCSEEHWDWGGLQRVRLAVDVPVMRRGEAVIYDSSVQFDTM